MWGEGGGERGVNVCGYMGLCVSACMSYCKIHMFAKCLHNMPLNHSYFSVCKTDGSKNLSEAFARHHSNSTCQMAV